MPDVMGAGREESGLPGQASNSALDTLGVSAGPPDPATLGVKGSRCQGSVQGSSVESQVGKPRGGQSLERPGQRLRGTHFEDVYTRGKSPSGDLEEELERRRMLMIVTAGRQR